MNRGVGDEEGELGRERYCQQLVTCISDSLFLSFS